MYKISCKWGVFPLVDLFMLHMFLFVLRFQDHSHNMAAICIFKPHDFILCILEKKIYLLLLKIYDVVAIYKCL